MRKLKLEATTGTPAGVPISGNRWTCNAEDAGLPKCDAEGSQAQSERCYEETQSVTSDSRG